MSSWESLQASEYGFYANVNPEGRSSALEPGHGTPHRWRRAASSIRGRRPTLPFNGYGEHVASLYDGMDLRVNF